MWPEHHGRRHGVFGPDVFVQTTTVRVSVPALSFPVRVTRLFAVTSCHVTHCRVPQVTTVATGFGGYLGNKGELSGPAPGSS